MAKKRKLRKKRVLFAGCVCLFFVLGIIKGVQFIFGKVSAINVPLVIDELVYSYDAVVVLDPGHGGIDCGSQNGKIYEKDITLKMSQAIGEELSHQNIKVIYTRKTDTQLSKDKQIDLNMRAQMSEENHADYFVSLHVNDYEDKSASVSGFEIYVKDEAGKELAQVIEQNVESLNYSPNRGIQDGSDLAVIRQNTVPSILIELGYINGVDIAYLNDDEKIKKLGQAIARGIVEEINKEEGNV